MQAGKGGDGGAGKGGDGTKAAAGVMYHALL